MRIASLSILVAMGLSPVCGCKTTVTETATSYAEPGAAPSSILETQLRRWEDEVGLYPKRHDLYYKIAGVQFQQENFHESVDALTHAIALKPDDAKYHYHLGRVHLHSGELSEAESEFRTAVRLMPAGRYTGSHAALGYVLAKQQRFDEALAEFQKCIAADPGNPVYFYFMGSIHDILGHRDETIRNFQTYLARGGQSYRTKVRFILEKLGVALADERPDSRRSGDGVSVSERPNEALLEPFGAGLDVPREASEK